KTEVLVIGEKNEREKLTAHLKTLALNTKHQARNLGVILDSDLNFETHIKNIIKTSFYHLRNIAKVQPFLAQADIERLMHAFITSRLDYCNSLLSGLPKKPLINYKQYRMQQRESSLKQDGERTSHQYQNHCT